MGVCLLASHFRPDHPVTAVLVLSDAGLVDGPGEAGPTTASIILILGAEKGLAGDDVYIDAFSLVIPVLILERGLRTAVLGYFKLKGSQPLFQRLPVGFLI